MATQPANITSLKLRHPIAQEARFSREFATLGNFRARSFDRPDWIVTVGVLDRSTPRIVPYMGITVPEQGQ